MTNRWWTYQHERFPILAHGPIIAAFSASAVCFSAILRGRDLQPNAFVSVPALPYPLSFLVAFATALLFFLQLRIADEFKDFDEDARYRPYRPIPRGLVTLRELGVVFALTAAVQLVLALWLYPPLLVLLGITWTYLVLMSKEFFVADWLKHRHILYMLSHMAIVPLVDFYATACDWRLAGDIPPHGLLWFVAVSYFNGLVIEMGRKIRGPHEEEEGVNTYSKLWGMRNASWTWLAAMFLTGILASIAGWKIGFFIPVLVLVTLLFLGAWGIVRNFLRDPLTSKGKRIETFAGIWTLTLYLVLGVVPFLWHWAYSEAMVRY